MLFFNLHPLHLHDFLSTWSTIRHGPCPLSFCLFLLPLLFPSCPSCPVCPRRSHPCLQAVCTPSCTIVALHPWNIKRSFLEYQFPSILDFHELALQGRILDKQASSLAVGDNCASVRRSPDESKATARAESGEKGSGIFKYIPDNCDLVIFLSKISVRTRRSTSHLTRRQFTHSGPKPAGHYRTSTTACRVNIPGPILGSIRLRHSNL